MVILAAALLQLSPQTLSIVSRGETVAALLREASQQSGIQMEAAPQTHDEIVITSVKNVSVVAFRTYLAEAIGAQWRRDGTIYRLGRTTALENAQVTAERKVRIKEVTAGVAALRKKLAAQSQFDDKAATKLASRVEAVITKYKGHTGDSPGLEAMMALEPEMPGGRLAIAIVASLTPEQLADVGPGDRIVYSNHPTRMQRQMPDSVDPAVKRYLAESELYSAALQMAKVSSSHGEESNQAQDPGPRGQPQTIIATTERSPFNPSLTVRMSLFDANGKLIDSDSPLFDMPDLTVPTAPVSYGKVELSPDAKRFYTAFQQLGKGKTFIDDKELVDQLSHPEQHDPLSYLAADGVLGIAQGKNVIACLTDDAFLMPTFNSMTPDGKLDLANFAKWLSGVCNIEQGEDWTVITPTHPVYTRLQRADRTVMGRFFRSAIDAGGPSLDDLANFAAQMPKRYMDSIAPMLAFFVLPELNAGIDNKNIEMLRIYSRLSSVQRADLESKGWIDINPISSLIRADLEDMAFRADAPVNVSVRIPKGVDPNSVGFGIGEEITVALPNGIPDHVTLSLTGQNFDAVILDDGESPTVSYRPMGAGQLASTIAQAEVADPTDKREQFSVKKYRFGHARSLQCTVDLADLISGYADFNVSQFPRKDSSVTFDNLPQSFRDAVQQAMPQARKQAAAMTPKRQQPPPE